MGESVTGRAPPDKREGPTEKAAVPKDGSLQLANQQIREAFKNEDGAATTPILKRQLAAKLLRFGRDTKGDSTTRYALYLEARRKAIAAVAPDLVFLVLDTMAKEYEVDQDEEKRTALAEMARSADDAVSVARLLGFAQSLVEQSAQAGRYDEALEFAGLAAAFAAEKDVEEQLVRDIATQQEEIATARTAGEILKTNPDDPKANYQLGRFWCLLRGEWKRGLPMLAKGSEPGYRKAAQMDLGQPTEAEDRKQLADAWWQLADESAGDEKAAERLRARARESYELALPRLSPLQKKIVQQRLARDPAGEAALADVPPSIVHLAYELDQRLGLYQEGEGYDENARGHREKYLRGSVSSHGFDFGALNPHYVLMPDGRFLEVVPPLEGSALHTVPIAKLAPVYWENPRLLHEARKSPLAGTDR